MDLRLNFETVLPPAIQAMIARKRGLPLPPPSMPDTAGPPAPPPMGPAPPFPPGAGPAGAPNFSAPPVPPPVAIAEMQAEIAKAEAAKRTAELGVAAKSIDLEMKRMDLAAKAGEVGSASGIAPDVLREIIEELARQRGMLEAIVAGAAPPSKI